MKRRREIDVFLELLFSHRLGLARMRGEIVDRNLGGEKKPPYEREFEECSKIPLKKNKLGKEELTSTL